MMEARSSRHDCTLRVKAPAKVNLWLEVLGRRPDGYHEIRTVMQAVSLYDDLSFRQRGDGRVVLHARGDGLPADEENLVVRAARLLKQRLGCPAGVEARLHKRIPVARGLGGGSSNCAATLRALSRLWRLELRQGDLQRLAAELGSDVPFFLNGGTALCEGRGERVTQLAVRGTFHYVLVIPPQPLSTRSVYQRLDGCLTSEGQGSSMEEVQRALARGDPRQLVVAVHNALLIPALQLSPDTRRIAGILESVLPLAGGRGCFLSGSGSALFGVFDTAEQARRAARKVKRQLGVVALAVESLPAMGSEH